MIHYAGPIDDFFGLRRDIGIEEWMHDVTPHGVVKSVHMTANWGATRALDETRWLQSIANRHGFPHGITCQADLTEPDIEAQLMAQREFPNMRGVRHQLHWDRAAAAERQPARPLQHAGVPPRFLAPGEVRPVFRTAGVRCTDALCGGVGESIPRHALPPPARRHAHRAKPGCDRAVTRRADGDQSPSPTFCENFRAVDVQSGLTVRHYRQQIRDTIQIFGIERTIYGSNFPLEKLHASYAELIGAYRTVLSEYSEDEQRRVFNDKAMRFYRL